jgi:hypothetical protein
MCLTALQMQTMPEGIADDPNPNLTLTLTLTKWVHHEGPGVGGGAGTSMDLSMRAGPGIYEWRAVYTRQLGMSAETSDGYRVLIDPLALSGARTLRLD